MKKLFALLLALCMLFSLAACGESAAPAPATEAPVEEAPAEEAPAEEAPAEEAPAEEAPAEEAPVEEAPAEEAPAEEAPVEEEPAEEAPAVLSYADYAAAEVDTEVAVECYVQAKQSWWDGKVTVYAADEDGAYFLYNMACSEEDNEKLVPGQKILVKGFKSEWAGEVEITDASFELLEGEPFIAEVKDITEVWGTVDMVQYMNQLVGFKGLTVEPYDESGAAFAYKNPEEKTDDLYFKVTFGDTTYEFCVEYYLCNEETDVYKAVENLQVGDVIDVEGFLYFYEGPNLQATSLTVVEAAPVMAEAEPAAEADAAADAVAGVPAEEAPAEEAPAEEAPAEEVPAEEAPAEEAPAEEAPAEEAPAEEAPAEEAPAEEAPAEEAPAEEAPAEEAPAEEAPAEEAPAVLSYADYAAAEVDTEVAVECYVQAKQSWWDNKVTVYAADEDGAYFIYELACSEEDNEKLVPGQKILVKGFKSEWSGEVEIIDASFELLEGEPFIAEAKDITEVWGTVDMIQYMNQLVCFKGLTVEPYDEDGAAFAYKNPEEKTDDLYFKVTFGDTTYEFCVEYYLCNEETEVYQAVENLQVGDVIDLEGFLYWYEGPNLQATALSVVEAAPAAEEAEPAVEAEAAAAAVAAEAAAEEAPAEEAPAEEAPAEETPAEEAPAEEAPAEETPAEEAPAEEAPAEEAPAEEAPAEEAAEEAPAEEAAEEAPAEEPVEEKGEGVMTYAEYAEAEVDTEVVIEGYVQAAQLYSEEYGNTSLYLADHSGAYFVYRLACTQEEYDSFVPGAKIRVQGFKSEWAGEVEIADASFELLESDEAFLAEPVDVTELLGTEELAENMNRMVSIKGAVVAESEGGAAFLYNWDGSGEDGSDLYFNVTLGEATYTFTVESDLCPAGSDVYEAVKSLTVGATVDLEGFLYWYEGPNPHITGIGIFP